MPEISNPRDVLFAAKFDVFMKELAAETGDAPVGALCLIHWRDSIAFQGHVDPTIPPQAKLNVVDRMTGHLHKIAQHFKARLNTMRARS